MKPIDFLTRYYISAIFIIPRRLDMAASVASHEKSRVKAAKAKLLLPIKMASAAGLIGQPKTKHINAKVQPRLFEAASKRAGSTSPAVVIEAALAALATQDDLGPWLAANWGSLGDIDPALLEELSL
jgi:hypothetical protein